MTYLVFGNDEERIRNYLKSLTKKFFKDEEANVIYFNSGDTPLKEVLDECYQLDLSLSKKMIVYSNCTFLRKKDKYLKVKETKVQKQNDYNKLISYINDDTSNDVLLVLTCESENIDKESEIFTSVPKENRKLLSDISSEEWPVYIKKYFLNKGLTIENDALNELNFRVNGNLTNFLNEAEKLEIYCNESITIKDIYDLTSKPIDDDIFLLTKSLLQRDKSRAIEIFRNLRITQNIEPITLINIMTSNLIFIDEVLYLKSMNKNNQEIATELNVKPGKVYFTLQDSKKLNTKSIKKALNDLCDLDKHIKHSECDRFYSFELFILNFK